MHDLGDGNWFQWVMTGLIGIAGVALKILSGRIDTAAAEIDKAREEAANDLQASDISHQTDRDRIWQTFTEHQRDMYQFRERMLSDMATKKDLEATEARLMAAIKSS